MSKKPSAETELRHVRRDLRLARQQLADINQKSAEWAARATRAERELKEWKDRFDLLLRSKPVDKP